MMGLEHKEASQAAFDAVFARHKEAKGEAGGSGCLSRGKISRYRLTRSRCLHVTNAGMPMPMPRPRPRPVT